jgi:hypothetical protein
MSQQALQRLRPAPEEIGRAIDLLRSFKAEARQSICWFLEGPPAPEGAPLHRWLDEKEQGLKALPEPLRKFIRGELSEDDTWLNQTAVRERCRYLDLAEKTLRKIATYNAAKGAIADGCLEAIDVTVALWFEPKAGKLTISGLELIEALRDADADPNRIRECPICKTLFWAGRIDKRGCSKPCANNLRVRDSRSKQRIVAFLESQYPRWVPAEKIGEFCGASLQEVFELTEQLSEGKGKRILGRHEKDGWVYSASKAASEQSKQHRASNLRSRTASAPPTDDHAQAAVMRKVEELLAAIPMFRSDHLYHALKVSVKISPSVDAGPHKIEITIEHWDPSESKSPARRFTSSFRLEPEGLS